MLEGGGGGGVLGRSCTAASVADDAVLSSALSHALGSESGFEDSLVINVRRSYVIMMQKSDYPVLFFPAVLLSHFNLHMCISNHITSARRSSSFSTSFHKLSNRASTATALL